MKWDCKKITQFFVRVVLSNFGALLLVVLYLIAGGQLFVFLEFENEKQSCAESMLKYYQKLNETVERAVTISESGSNRTVLHGQIMVMLTNFSQDVYTLDVSPLANCETLGEPNNLPGWNLVNSIYFCATIMTTIGYGHISPSTQWGRIVCIIYSFIGIPLMLIFLGSLGEFLANVFRQAYINMCCCRCFLSRQHMRDVDDYRKNDSSAPELETQNDGDMVKIGGPPAKVFNVVEEETEENGEEEDDVINIPIIIVTGFLVLYMFCGAYLFQIWEDWDLVAGVYFTFITVSTIGFGDLYPAKDTIGSDKATIELLVGAIYALVGLAVLSMCVSLVQEEVYCKFIWLSQKFRCCKKRTEDGEDENKHRDSQQFDDAKPIFIKPSNASIEMQNSPRKNNSQAFVNESYDKNESEFQNPKIEDFEDKFK